MIRILGILFIAVQLMACNAQNNATPVNTEEFKTLSQEEDIYVIDVRTPGEVADASISLTDYYFNINDSKFEENIASLDKTKSYVVFCRSGKRSSSAISYMEQQGFTKLYELSGGILAWEDKNLLESN